MQHKFLLLCLIGGVAYFLIEQVSNAMLHDNNAIIRFLGYKDSHCNGYLCIGFYFISFL
mgnify:CR=1 FL=1